MEEILVTFAMMLAMCFFMVLFLSIVLGFAIYLSWYLKQERERFPDELEYLMEIQDMDLEEALDVIYYIFDEEQYDIKEEKGIIKVRGKSKLGGREVYRFAVTSKDPLMITMITYVYYRGRKINQYNTYIRRQPALSTRRLRWTLKIKQLGEEYGVDFQKLNREIIETYSDPSRYIFIDDIKKWFK